MRSSPLWTVMLLTAAVWIFTAVSFAQEEEALTEGQEKMLKAAEEGDLAQVQALVAAGIHPDFSRTVYCHGEAIGGGDVHWSITQSPLWEAAYNGQAEVMNWLLAHGVDKKDLALDAAAKGGHWELVEALLAAGASREIALLRAVSARRTALVYSLLAQGVDVNTKGRYNYTPLLEAASSCYTEIMQKLVAKGASPQARTSWSETMLHLAASGGCVDSLDFILAHGGALEAEDMRGERPLHAAAVDNRTEMVVELLKRGANPNAANKDGETPLHLAMQDPEPKVVAALLQGKADPNLKNRDGVSPLDMARTREDQQLIELLSKGVQPPKK